MPLLSWADKVRGTVSSASTTTNAVPNTTDVKGRDNQNATPELRHSNMKDCVVQDVIDDGDEEGWETVHRGRKTHSNHAKKGNKTGYNHEKPTNGRTGANLNNLRTEKVMNGTQCVNGDVENHVKNHVDNQGVNKEVCSGATCNSKEVDSGPNSNSVEASEELMEISDDRETSPVFLDGDEEDQDSLSDIENDKALSAAMEEEESLSRQIEEWHDQTIASVIEHEESLTKEIAEEEELVTQINGESESQVSDIEQELEDVANINIDEENSLNCSGATNGDSVSCYITCMNAERGVIGNVQLR